MRVNNVNSGYQNKQNFGMKLIVPEANQEKAMFELQKMAFDLAKPKKNVNNIYGDVLQKGKSVINKLFHEIVKFNKEATNHKTYPGKANLKITPYYDTKRQLMLQVAHDSNDTSIYRGFEFDVTNEDIDIYLKSIHNDIGYLKL